MHDCPNIQEKLFDLVMNETEISEQSRILAEVSLCALCQAELESLEKTLLLYDQIVSSNEPTITEWQDYEQNLRSQFATQIISSKSFWRRLTTTSIRVPAPVLAAVVLLACSVAALLAFRPIKSDSPQSAAAEIVQTPAETFAPSALPAPASTPERIIIREERVVTRNVYVTKQTNGAKQASSPQTVKNSLEIGQNPLNLAEFKPVSSITPNVVKGNKPK